MEHNFLYIFVYFILFVLYHIIKFFIAYRKFDKSEIYNSVKNCKYTIIPDFIDKFINIISGLVSVSVIVSLYFSFPMWVFLPMLIPICVLAIIAFINIRVLLNFIAFVIFGRHSLLKMVSFLFDNIYLTYISSNKFNWHHLIKFFSFDYKVYYFNENKNYVKVFIWQYYND